MQSPAVDSPGFKLFSNMGGTPPVSAQLKELNESVADKEREMEDYSPFIAAAEAGDELTVRRMILGGTASVNQVDAEGWTALIAAASEGHRAVVDTILFEAENVAVNAANDDGETALIRATLGGHAEVVNALLATDGLNVNSKTGKGTTALMFAAMFGHEGIATSLLVTDGIDVNLADASGKTALLHAVDSGNEGIATLIATEVPDTETTSAPPVVNGVVRLGAAKLPPRSPAPPKRP
jgi:ankyrin repeat protein